MKALVAAAAALVTLFCGSPALAAQGPGATGAPVGSSHPSMVRTKAKASEKARAKQVRIVRVSDARPKVGRTVVVTGRTGVSSRTVTLQVRRQTAKGPRWVAVDRARSQRGRFRLAARIRHADGSPAAVPRTRAEKRWR